MTADLGSRSDLEALQRSGRGKTVVLVLMLLAALGAAIWWFALRRKGVGNPEDPTKVLVVSRGTTVGYSVVLNDAGFDAAEGTLSAWEHKADEELEDNEETGVAAVMTLADTFGYGYVAFEFPQDVDLSPLDIDGGAPQFPEHVRWAVLSVGDFGVPHVVTHNPEPSKVMRDNAVVLLQALFQQEKLNVLLPENDSPNVADIQLRDRVHDALDKLARLPEAEQMAEKIVLQIREQLEDGERAQPRPRLLGEPLESGTPVPLPSGDVLGIIRGFSVVTRDAVRADLDLEDEERFVAGPAQGSPDERSTCDSLAGGKISVHDSARYAFASDGSVILVKSLSEGLTLWTAGDQGCVFAKTGTVPQPAAGFEGLGVPHKSGAVARHGTIGGTASIAVLGAGSEDRQLLGMLLDAEFGEPVWIDEHHLVATAQSFGSDAIFLLSTEHPTKLLQIRSIAFDGGGELGYVAAVPGKNQLLVSSGSFPHKVYRLDLPSDIASMFASPPTPEGFEEVIEPGLPTIYPIDTNQLVATALSHEGRVRSIAVSPDGKLVAFGLRDSGLDEEEGDEEIALAPIAGGTMRLLTRNAIKDHSPRFTADSKQVVFRTRVEIPKTSWVVTSPRVVSVQ